jgi:hypothetical protein
VNDPRQNQQLWFRLFFALARKAQIVGAAQLMDREKLHSAFAHTILPYAQETASDKSDEGGLLNDSFVIKTAAFLTQEVVDSGLDITDDQANLDDEELENLPIAQLLVPHLQELLFVQDPIVIVSETLRIYTSEASEADHQRLSYGPCEAHPIKPDLR